MKNIFILLAAFLLSSSALAETKWYYNPDRSGEGMVLTELDKGVIAFGFYSHVEEPISSPPIVSPPPPLFNLFCDQYTVWFTGLSKVVGKDGAYGDVFYDVGKPNFPTPIKKKVSDQYVVGSFILSRKGDGFILYMESNNLMCNLSVFGVNHYFTEILVE